MIDLYVPDHKRGEFPNRKCEGKFPTWEVDETAILPWRPTISTPRICTSCELRDVCKTLVAHILVCWPEAHQDPKTLMSFTDFFTRVDALDALLNYTDYEI